MIAALLILQSAILSSKPTAQKFTIQIIKGLYYVVSGSEKVSLWEGGRASYWKSGENWIKTAGALRLQVGHSGRSKVVDFNQLKKTMLSDPSYFGGKERLWNHLRTRDKQTGRYGRRGITLRLTGLSYTRRGWIGLLGWEIEGQITAVLLSQVVRFSFESLPKMRILRNIGAPGAGLNHLQHAGGRHYLLISGSRPRLEEIDESGRTLRVTRVFRGLLTVRMEASVSNRWLLLQEDTGTRGTDFYVLDTATGAYRRVPIAPLPRRFLSGATLSVIDLRRGLAAFHDYAAKWTPSFIYNFGTGKLVRVQKPSYDDSTIQLFWKGRAFSWIEGNATPGSPYVGMYDPSSGAVMAKLSVDSKIGQWRSTMDP